MKIKGGNSQRQGVSLAEVLIITLTLAVVVLVLISSFHRYRDKSKRIRCISKLKQTSISFRIFANDHDDRFPQQLSEEEGGAKEAVTRGEAFRVFLLMSNELSVPSTVICPSDSRKAAAEFSTFSNTNVSYFLGVEAIDTKSEMLLLGDRNLMVRDQLLSGLVPLRTNPEIRWSGSTHKHAGNFAQADGSVYQATTPYLLDQLKRSGDTNNLVLFPQ